MDMVVEGDGKDSLAEALTGDIRTDGSRLGSYADLGKTGWAAVV